MLNKRSIADLDGRPLILGGTGFRIAGLFIRRLGVPTHCRRPLYLVLLCHYLFAFHSSILQASTTWFRAFGPFGDLPSHWAIQDIAVLAIRWRWLRTHIIRNDHCVFSSPRYLMNAMDLPRLHANTTRLSAGRKVRVVPSRRARNVITRSDAILWLRFGGTEERGGGFASVITNTSNNQFLNTTQTGGTTAGVAILSPGIRPTPFRRAHFNAIMNAFVITAGAQDIHNVQRMKRDKFKLISENIDRMC